MQVFEVVIALLLAGAGLAALARRLATPYPALVALAGVGLALIPGAPTLVLDPELALALFVAPVLLDAAFDSSPRDLRANWQQVTGLALGAVVTTILAVALIARTLVPDMSWSVAVALGAIVAPPDAAAATAVLQHLRPPHRLLVILGGESLFNDASALLVYRLAVGAAVAGSLSARSVIPTLLLVTAGSIVLAAALARVLIFLSPRITDVASAVIFQFCSTFGVWLLAERLHLSGILTMVVYAMIVARSAPAVVPARIRVPSYAVWEVAVFVLNVLAFILVGLQLKSIVLRFDRATWIEYTGVAIAVCGVTIVARLVWVMSAFAVSRRLSSRGALLVGWCGMRGIVTLAAALALPTAFPHRDLILFTALAVVVGTLVLQGMTLRLIMGWLKLEDEGEVEREVRLARVETLKAGLSETTADDAADTAALLRQRYELLLRRADDGGQPDDADVVRTAAAAERQRLVALRDEGTIGDAAFQRVEQELDVAELDLEQLLRSRR